MASCYLIFSRQRFNASDLASHFVPSSGGPHMNLRVVFQTLKTRCKQKNAFASYLNGCVHEKKYYKEIIKPCIGWMKQCMCIPLCHRRYIDHHKCQSLHISHFGRSWQRWWAGFGHPPHSTKPPSYLECSRAVVFHLESRLKSTCHPG